MSASLQEQLKVIIADLEALADEIQRAIDYAVVELDGDESISHLKRAKTATLHGSGPYAKKAGIHLAGEGFLPIPN